MTQDGARFVVCGGAPLCAGDRVGEDDLHERADWLAAATNCDRTAIWEWGTAERVLSGLWCRVVDHQPHGDKQLADAERFCA